MEIWRPGFGLGCRRASSAKSSQIGVSLSAYNEIQLSSFVDQIFERLRALEAQMARVSEAASVPYDPPGVGVPQEVVDLVQAGDRMGAIRKYRELTGAGMEQAQEVIAKL